MAVGSITRIMEQIGIFDPANPETYNRFNDSDVNGIAITFNTQSVYIVIGIQKGKDGRADKNEVKEWPSPNPKSHGYKAYQLAKSGAESVSPVVSGAAVASTATITKPAQPAVGTVKPPWMK
jgi:hypothetical protein